MDVNIGNSLLAYALGFTDSNEGWTDTNNVLKLDKDHFKENELQFHKDWNWLMVVVEWCKENITSECSEYEALRDSLFEVNKNLVWMACIHCVQLHNSTLKVLASTNNYKGVK